MSPILVRPVREQFEHDRVIRVLQAKYKRKYEVAINPGAEQNAAVGVGELAMYPDLVLFGQERNRRVQGTVEVETTESINTLEAQAEWGPFSKLRTPFFLYVPASSIDTVRRLCAEHGIDPAEIWTYHTALDQVRFTMVYRSPDAPKGSIAEHKPKPPAPVLLDETTIEPAKPAAKPPSVKPLPAKAPANKVPASKVAANTPAKSAPSKPAKPAKSASGKSVTTKAASGKSAGAKSAKPAKPARSGGAKPASAKASSTKANARSAKSAKAKTRR